MGRRDSTTAGSVMEGGTVSLLVPVAVEDSTAMGEDSRMAAMEEMAARREGEALAVVVVMTAGAWVVTVVR